MRILLISDSIYPFNKGGKEKRIYEFVGRIAKKNISVLVFTMKWWDGAEDVFIENGVKYIAVSKKVPLYSEEKVRSLWQAVYFAVALFIPLFKHRNEYDLVDADQIPYLQLFVVKIAMIFLKKPFFCTWHEVFGMEYWKKYLGGIKGFLAAHVEKHSSHLPDVIIPVSASTEVELREKLGVIKNITVIENGVDVAEIASSIPLKDSYDLVFAGRLLEHKNINFLLDVLSSYKKKYQISLRVALIGDGPEKRSLEKKCKNLGLDTVSFLGFLENHLDVYSYMKSSRAFVFPSEREGFGLVVLEAYACGIPVITLDMPKNHARDLVIEGRTGMKVAKDIDIFAQAIHEVLEWEKGYYLSSLNDVLKKHSWDSSTKQLLELYSTVSIT